MSKKSFRFRQFEIRQDHCAMKVGTDGVLLGAWTGGGQRILDVGTGTGLISLMVAQRFPDAAITAIDVDKEACRQAQENFMLSPFSENIVVQNVPFQQFKGSECFDSIVCNPPFFTNSLLPPDAARSIARHAEMLSYSDLCRNSWRLLTVEGELSVIVPFDYRSAMDMEAVIAGLFPSRVCSVRTTATKPVRRYLLAYTKRPTAVEQSELVIGSEEYKSLVSDFYL